MGTSVHPAISLYLIAFTVLTLFMLFRFAFFYSVGASSVDKAAKVRVPARGLLTAMTVAVIAISIDVESSNDMTEQVLEQMGDLPEEVQAMNMEIEYMDVEMDIEAEGILYWDMSANHAHSMTLSGSMNMVMDMAMNMSQGGQEMQMEQMFEMSGSFENAMAVSIN